MMFRLALMMHLALHNPLFQAHRYAVAICWCVARSLDEAKSLAMSKLRDGGWNVVKLISEEDIPPKNESERRARQKALRQGYFARMNRRFSFATTTSWRRRFVSSSRSHVASAASTTTGFSRPTRVRRLRECTNAGETAARKRSGVAVGWRSRLDSSSPRWGCSTRYGQREGGPRRSQSSSGLSARKTPRDTGSSLPVALTVD